RPPHSRHCVITTSSSIGTRSDIAQHAARHRPVELGLDLGHGGGVASCPHGSLLHIHLWRGVSKLDLTPDRGLEIVDEALKQLLIGGLGHIYILSGGACSLNLG